LDQTDEILNGIVSKGLNATMEWTNRS
jgi:hypothetical protein